MTRDATALFARAGTGKTYVSMAVLEWVQPRLALIIAPLTSLDVVWGEKLATLPDYTLLRGLKQLTERLKSDPKGILRAIVLTNPEALRAHYKRIDKYPWDYVIIDESQSIKDRNSINSRIARRLRHVPRRLALSGTPIDTGQIDIWAQMRFVDHTVFGEDWRDFANAYCYKTGWQGKEWKFDDKKDAEFKIALKKHIFRLEDHFLGLAPMQVHTIPVQILGTQRQIYEEMRRHSVIHLDGEDIIGYNAGARDVKLSQITGGAVLGEERAHPTGEAKFRRLVRLLINKQPPLVVFCQFLHELAIVQRALPSHWRVNILRGSVTGDERTDIIRHFQAGHIDCLICQVRTGGESIDLTAADTLIMYSMTYSYINFEQVMRRLQRGGQKRQVSVYILYCVNTIDEDKLCLVKNKSDTSSRVLSFFEGES